MSGINANSMWMARDWSGMDEKRYSFQFFLWLFDMYIYLIWLGRVGSKAQRFRKTGSFHFLFFVLLIYSCRLFPDTFSDKHIRKGRRKRDWTEWRGRRKRIKWIVISIEIQFTEQMLLSWWYGKPCSSLRFRVCSWVCVCACIFMSVFALFLTSFVLSFWDPPSSQAPPSSFRGMVDNIVDIRHIW